MLGAENINITLQKFENMREGKNLRHGFQAQRKMIKK